MQGPPTDPDHPGNHVRRFREQRGWKQADLMRASKTPKAVLSRIESGESVGRFATLKALATSLNVHVSELFGGNASPLAIDHRIDGQGVLASPHFVKAFRAAAKSESTPPELIAVREAGAGWFAARVTSEKPLVATLDPGITHDIRPSDILVFRPLADEQPEHGRVVWAVLPPASKKDDPLSELRVWRLLDGAKWLWPFAGTGQRPEPAEGWELRAVMVEQRRRG